MNHSEVVKIHSEVVKETNRKYTVNLPSIFCGTKAFPYTDRELHPYYSIERRPGKHHWTIYFTHNTHGKEAANWYGKDDSLAFGFSVEAFPSLPKALEALEKFHYALISSCQAGCRIDFTKPWPADKWY